MSLKQKLTAAWARVGPHYRRNKNLVNTILTPLILSILPIALQTREIFCAYVILIMSVFWVLQCIPIALTSLMPVFMFPMFGIMKAKDISPYYFADNVMFIFASVVIGIGIEASGLHKKIALRVCMLVGSEPKWLLLGIMSAAGFLSVWISNTATTTMIYPIVISLVKQIVILNPEFAPEPENQIELGQIQSTAHLVERSATDVSIAVEDQTKAESHEAEQKVENVEPVRTENDENVFKSKKAKSLIKCFSLAITYSATICGTASLIGTSSNIVFKGYFEKVHPNDSLNFLTFMLYSTPISVINVIMCWVILCVIWLPKGMFISFKKDAARDEHRKSVKKTVDALIKQEYEKLGPYTWEQISIGTMFTIAVLLWVTRDLVFVDGWSALFIDGYMDSDTPAGVLMVFIAMSWPKQNIFKGHEYKPLMTWNDIQTMFQWSLIFLVGGSLVMAQGCDISGLSTWFGNFLENILPTDIPVLCLFIIGIFSIIGTEFISNVSMISIILPILETLGQNSRISYYYLMLPQAISVNFSYMLPAAAPSNAVVFARGYLTLKDFILTGLLLKIVNYGVLFAASNTYLELIFPSPYGPLNSTQIFTTTAAMLIENTATSSDIFTTSF